MMLCVVRIEGLLAQLNSWLLLVQAFFVRPPHAPSASTCGSTRSCHLAPMPAPPASKFAWATAGQKETREM